MDSNQKLVKGEGLYTVAPKDTPANSSNDSFENQLSCLYKCLGKETEDSDVVSEKSLSDPSGIAIFDITKQRSSLEYYQNKLKRLEESVADLHEERARLFCLLKESVAKNKVYEEEIQKINRKSFIGEEIRIDCSESGKEASLPDFHNSQRELWQLYLSTKYAARSHPDLEDRHDTFDDILQMKDKQIDNLHDENNRLRQIVGELEQDLLSVDEVYVRDMRESSTRIAELESRSNTAQHQLENYICNDIVTNEIGDVRDAYFKSMETIHVKLDVLHGMANELLIEIKNIIDDNSRLSNNVSKLSAERHRLGSQISVISHLKTNIECIYVKEEQLRHANKVLESRIRSLEHSLNIESGKSVHWDYLKNIITNFINNKEQRSILIPVISSVLGIPDGQLKLKE